MSEEQKRKIYEKYVEFINKFAFRMKLAGFYSESFIELMRTTYFGGIPASILLLLPQFCSGFCYERATLMAAVLKEENFRRVDGNILGIRFDPQVIKEVSILKKKGEPISPNYTNHCWIEILLNRSWYVIDVTDGTIWLRNLFYLIQMPKITRICSKEEIVRDPDYLDILNADIEKDKWAALLLLPILERHVEDSIYREQLLKEIAFYKESIHYEELVEQDKKEKTERAKLDSMRFKMTNKNAD